MRCSMALHALIEVGIMEGQICMELEWKTAVLARWGSVENGTRATLCLKKFVAHFQPRGLALKDNEEHRAFLFLLLNSLLGPVPKVVSAALEAP